MKDSGPHCVKSFLKCSLTVASIAIGSYAYGSARDSPKPDPTPLWEHQPRLCIELLLTAVSSDPLAALSSALDVIAITQSRPPRYHSPWTEVREEFIRNHLPGILRNSTTYIDDYTVARLFRMSATQWTELLQSRTAQIPPMPLPWTQAEVTGEALNIYQLRLQTFYKTLEWAWLLEAKMAEKRSGLVSRDFYEGVTNYIVVNLPPLFEVVDISHRLPLRYRNRLYEHYLHKTIEDIRLYPCIAQDNYGGNNLSKVLTRLLQQILSYSDDWLSGRVWPELDAHSKADYAPLSRAEIQLEFAQMLHRLLVNYSPKYHGYLVSGPQFIDSLFEAFESKRIFFSVLPFETSTLVGSASNRGVSFVKGVGAVMQLWHELGTIDHVRVRHYAHKLVILGEQMLGHRPNNEPHSDTEAFAERALSLIPEPADGKIGPQLFQQMTLEREVGSALIREGERLMARLSPSE